MNFCGTNTASWLASSHPTTVVCLGCAGEGAVGEGLEVSGQFTSVELTFSFHMIFFQPGSRLHCITC